MNYDVLLQLRCCAVHRDGWEVYRETEWFKKFGAKDGQTILKYTYGRHEGEI